MRAIEKQIVKEKVEADLMPIIKDALPGVLAWVLHKIFPKLQDKIIVFITGLFEQLLRDRGVK